MLLLDDEHLKDTIQTLAKIPDGVKLLWHLLAKSNFDRKGLAKDERTECYNRGYGDFGLYIREIIIEYAPKVYFDYIEEGEKENG